MTTVDFAIPSSVQKAVAELVENFNQKFLAHHSENYVCSFRGNYLYLDSIATNSLSRDDYPIQSSRMLDEGNPVCRLKYNGATNKWDFAIYLYSDQCYSVNEVFEGDEFVDGTVLGALKAGKIAYLDSL